MQATQDELSEQMRAAVQGDVAAYRRALAALAVRLRPAVRSALARCGQGTDAVEDIVQESLLAIHLKRATWDIAQPVEPWARAIARFKTIDHLRRRGSRVHIEIEELSETLAGPESDAADAAETAMMRRAVVAKLPPQQRAIVESMSMMGASARETGDRLGMTEGAVRVSLHRALKTLAAMFKENRP